MLSNSVKQFIEKNISMIEEEEFDMLYDEAYEWLADDRGYELTKILSSTLNIKNSLFQNDFPKKNHLIYHLFHQTFLL